VPPADFEASSLTDGSGLQPLGSVLVTPPDRLFAAVQVFLVCGIPTQIVVSLALLYHGSPMAADGSTVTVDPAKISLEFFAMSSLFDTALIAILIRVFLAMSGENSGDVLLGRRPVVGEAIRGLVLIPVLWIAVISVILAITTLLPSLHSVAKNPLAAYMDSPIKAGVFIVVVILAGGVREELQRGFILHRFEQRLGGARVGLVIFSVAFGLFHVQQGFDVAIAVGLLGIVWGVLYIRRRSVVTSMVSHAGFDVVEVLQQVLLRSLPL
jgi:membrane protease YdiL (CAAX protease family)